jgi:hypothetical protein
MAGSWNRQANFRPMANSPLARETVCAVFNKKRNNTSKQARANGGDQKENEPSKDRKRQNKFIRRKMQIATYMVSFFSLSLSFLVITWRSTKSASR